MNPKESYRIKQTARELKELVSSCPKESYMVCSITDSAHVIMSAIPFLFAYSRFDSIGREMNQAQQSIRAAHKALREAHKFQDISREQVYSRAVMDATKVYNGLAQKLNSQDQVRSKIGQIPVLEI